MTETYAASKLYAHWYDIRSRAMYLETGQGALWRAQNNRSVEVVGVILIPSVSNRSNWDQYRIDSGTLTVNVVAAQTTTLRLYRSTQSTYVASDITGAAYIDTTHGYTELTLSGTTAGQQTATLTAANCEFLHSAFKDGTTIFCLYYAGDTATQDNPSDHYVRVDSFSLSLEVNNAYSLITSATDAYIETASTVSWTNYITTGRTNTLRVQFGSIDSGEIPVSGSSHSYTLPATWYAELPNSSSGTATVTLYTYLNGTEIGHDTVTFTASVSSTITPLVQSIGATTINDNVTVAGWGIILQGYSKSRIDALCSAGAGASITGYTISSSVESNTILSTSGSYSFTTIVFPIGGTIRYTLTVTDSRGRTGSDYVDIVVLPYASPSITAMAAVRCDSDGTENSETGTYAKAAINYTWSQVGSNTMTNEIRFKRHQDLSYTVAATNVSSWTWSSVFGGGLLDVATAYDVQGYIVDALGNSATFNVVLASVAGFHLGLKNDRARFGGVCERQGLEVDWVSYFNGSVTVNNSLTIKPPATNSYPIYVKNNSDALGFQMINHNGVCVASFYDAGTERNYLGNGRFSCYDSSGTEQARLSSDKSLKLGNTTLTEAQLISLLNMI